MELFKKSEVQPFFLLIVPVWFFYDLMAVVVVIFTVWWLLLWLFLHKRKDYGDGDGGKQ